MGNYCQNTDFFQDIYFYLHDSFKINQNQLPNFQVQVQSVETTDVVWPLNNGLGTVVGIFAQNQLKSSSERPYPAVLR